MKVKERLRALRAERRETQKQVAEAIGIKERHYQFFEHGKHLPSLENAWKLGTKKKEGLVKVRPCQIFGHNHKYCIRLDSQRLYAVVVEFGIELRNDVYYFGAVFLRGG